MRLFASSHTCLPVLKSFPGGRGVVNNGAAWERRFVARWPPGSDAHRSYYERIANGPAYALRDAA